MMPDRPSTTIANCVVRASGEVSTTIAPTTRPSVGAAVPRPQKISIRRCTPMRPRRRSSLPSSARAATGRRMNSAIRYAIVLTTRPAMTTANATLMTARGWYAIARIG